MSYNLIGTIILNQFRVDQFVGSGAMGTVYRVWDLQRSVPLAMKILNTDLAEYPSILKRFEREAQALEKLSHPHIVPFYGLFNTPDFSFILEKYIDGPTLRDLFRARRNQPFPPVEALTYFKALTSAVGYAHANGIIHCDIKPGNLLIDQGGFVYLTDFGVARHAESTMTTLGIAGTPAYMAPEQLLGQALTPATDIYALGIMLFQLLTGQRPFRAAEEGSEEDGFTPNDRIRQAQLNLSPPDPLSLNPALPAEIRPVIYTAMEKRPKERQKSTQELYTEAYTALHIDPASIPDRVHLPAEFQEDPQADTLVQRKAARPVRLDPAAIKEAGFTPVEIFRLLMLITAGAILVALILVALFRQNPVPTAVGNLNPTATGNSPTQASPALAAQITNTPAGQTATTGLPNTGGLALTGTPLPNRYSLAFASDRSGHFQVYVMDPNHPKDWKQVPDPTGYPNIWWPSFCGSQMAVEAWGKDPQWIYFINPNGNKAQRLDPPNSSDALGIPRCSPDGQNIAYSARKNGTWSVAIAALADFHLVVQLPNPQGATLNGNVSWSQGPIFFSMIQTGDTFQILSYLNFNSPGNIILQGKYPAASPNGREVAFDDRGNGRIALFNLDSGSLTTLHSINNIAINGEFPPEGAPVWSPDGQWIYFTSADSGNIDIYRIHPDGSGLQDLTKGWSSNEVTPAVR